MGIKSTEQKSRIRGRINNIGYINLSEELLNNSDGDPFPERKKKWYDSRVQLVDLQGYNYEYSYTVSKGYEISNECTIIYYIIVHSLLILYVIYILYVYETM